MLPIPDFLLPDVPLPPLSEPLFTAALVVAGIGFFVEAIVMFYQIAQPENDREYVRYALQAAPPVGMFALDYATGSLWGLAWWGGMYLFDAIRFRYGYSMRAVIALVIATIRRIVQEIRKRL